MFNRLYFFICTTFIMGVCFGLGGASSLIAQEMEADEFSLEEITVTAQKREENQQKVAIAMDVISAESIKELGKNNIDEILTNISGAIVQKAGDGYRVSIRGMSDDQATAFGQSQSTPAVAINTDGVYSNRKDTAISLFDIERVEVLYGPQSTMYSSNSPGGIVNVVTASPKLDRWEASGTLEAGDYNLFHTEGALNVPLTDTTALRVSFSTSTRDGYLTGGGDNEDTKQMRLRALYQPNDNLSFVLTGEYSKDEGNGFGSGVDEFDKQDDVDNPWTARSSESLQANDQETRKIFMNMNWDLEGIGSLSFIPSYTTRKGENVMDFMDSIQYGEQDIEEKSMELRMTSSADFSFKWILGVNYYNITDINNMLSAEYVVNNGAIGDYRLRTNTEEAKAIFANITYPIVDNFRVTAGIRKSWDEMVTENHERKMGNLTDEEPTQNSPSSPDYKIGFEYDLGENSMLYADWATSYRVQAMTTVADPQELSAYSLGAKNRFFNNKLQLNVAAYYYDYQNYNPNWHESIWFDLNGDGQQPQKGPVPVGQQSEYVDDSGVDGVTGNGRSMGVDLSANAVITSQDMLNINIAYTNSEWTDLYFAWEYSEQDKLIDGVVQRVPHPDKDYSGKPMTNTPPWTINLNYTHSFNLWNGGVLKTSLSTKYQTGYYLSWEDDYYPYNYQETHHIEDASMAYSFPNGKWTLSAYINNIFDYAEKRSYMNIAGIGALSIGNPRTYGAVLSARF